jgi:hypothetical protein
MKTARISIFLAGSIICIIVGIALNAPNIIFYGGLLLIYTFIMFCQGLLLKIEDLSEQITELSDKIDNLTNVPNPKSPSN